MTFGCRSSPPKTPKRTFRFHFQALLRSSDIEHGKFGKIGTTNTLFIVHLGLIEPGLVIPMSFMHGVYIYIYIYLHVYIYIFQNMSNTFTFTYIWLYFSEYMLARIALLYNEC